MKNNKKNININNKNKVIKNYLMNIINHKKITKTNKNTYSTYNNISISGYQTHPTPRNTPERPRPASEPAWVGVLPLEVKGQQG